MKVAVCAIAKLENRYLREWVEHYYKLGFTNIILYDNNDLEGESFNEVIDDYIKKGFVIVKNVRGIPGAQIKSYDSCYKEFNNDYNWIAFFDIDEFLHLKSSSNIIDFLSNPIFSKFNCIKINWLNFDDNNLVKVENDNYSFARFSHSIKYENYTTKSIVRTKITNCSINSSHGPLSFDFTKYKFSKAINSSIVSCDTNGKQRINVKDAYTPNSEANLYHYRFKTIDEYVRLKINRGYPNTSKKFGSSILKLNIFFTYNKLSYKKYKYAKELLKKYPQFKVQSYLSCILVHFGFKIGVGLRLLRYTIHN